MKIKVLRLEHFCLFRGREIGIAVDGESAKMFKNNVDYLSAESEKDFGWIDHYGEYYVDNKENMSRPTLEQVVREINNFPDLLAVALRKKLIRINLREHAKTKIIKQYSNSSGY